MKLFTKKQKRIDVDRLAKLTDSLGKLQEQRETVMRSGTKREYRMYTIMIDQLLTRTTGYKEPQSPDTTPALEDEA